MSIKLSGMISGMDTDSIVKELMSAQSMKKTKVENKKTKLEWKQDIWKSLNTKLYNFYTGTVSKMRLQGSYMTKKATSSDSEALTVTAGNSAPTGSHTVEIRGLASSQYVTSADLSSSGNKVVSGTTLVDGLGMEKGTIIHLKSGIDGKDQSFTVTADSTVGNFVSFCKDAGLNANFDEKQQRIFLSSKTSGSEKSFTLTTAAADPGFIAAENALKDKIARNTLNEDQTAIYDNAIKTLSETDSAVMGDAIMAVESGTDIADMDESLQTAALAYKNLKEIANDLGSDTSDFGSIVQNYVDNYGKEVPGVGADGTSQLSKLGLGEITDNVEYTESADGFSMKAAADAEIVLDGAVLKGTSNTMTVNNITLNLQKAEVGKTISFTISNDTDAVYNMVKDFVKGYNEIMKEMNTLYNADRAKGYEPLTSEQKDAMSDDEVEKWEKKIKDSLLRRDGTLGSLVSSFRTAMLTQTEYNGKKYSLSSFGIVTSSDYTEGGLLHIKGDADDDTYGSEPTNKLKKALEEDPDAVVNVLSDVMKNLYQTMTDKMSKTALSSALTFYNDEEMKDQLDDYKSQLSDWEDKLSDMEDRYYKQFSRMEIAMSKLQSQSNYFSSMMGNG